MKTIIVAKENEETFAEVLEYQNEEQKKWMMENLIKKTNLIFVTEIDGFSYIQHKKESPASKA